MPHLVLRDEVDFDFVLERMPKDAVKWGAAVLKTAELWRLAAVERTPAVQRWLAVVARDLQQLGAGAVRSTNIAPALLEELRMDRG